MTTQTMTRPTGTTTTVAATVGAVTAKGWHEDPRGQHKLRFHDGCGWTEHTTHFGPVPCVGCSH